MKGLVVCGGNSSRMKEDKSLLEYHSVPQRDHLYDLLSGFCDEVFLSLNKEQSQNYTGQHPVITDEDEFSGIGPVCSLLSFQKHHPGEAVLCAGCDYPFADAELMNLLLDNRGGSATCFVHEDGTPEPMITIYESPIIGKIYDNFLQGKFSLSKILKEEGAVMIEPPSERSIENVNTPDEYFLAKEFLKYKNIML